MAYDEFENLYGKTITPQELAKFLKLDARTVVKYAHQWGGVAVAPGKYRFFENVVKRRLELSLTGEKYIFESEKQQKPELKPELRKNAFQSGTAGFVHVKKGPGNKGNTKKNGSGKQIKTKDLDKHNIF